MALRPVFVPLFDGPGLVREEEQEFRWVSGMSASQKRKNVDSLHEAYVLEHPKKKVLEVSSFSRQAIGVALSAFNLTLEIEGIRSSVECFFQGSKVFSTGGPYQDLYGRSPREAKKDPRIQDGSRLRGFSFFGTEWSLEPRNAFYDWIYLNAIKNNQDIIEEIAEYDAFTDIAFNPKRSVNCQARTVAICVSLTRQGLMDSALQSQRAFLGVINDCHRSQTFESGRLAF